MECTESPSKCRSQKEVYSSILVVLCWSHAFCSEESSLRVQISRTASIAYLIMTWQQISAANALIFYKDKGKEYR